jgi:hypothetical protein
LADAFVELAALASGGLPPGSVTTATAPASPIPSTIPILVIMILSETATRADPVEGPPVSFRTYDDVYTRYVKGS